MFVEDDPGMDVEVDMSHFKVLVDNDVVDDYLNDEHSDDLDDDINVDMSKLVGNYRVHYGLFRSYYKELIKANPCSTFKIDVEPCSNPSSDIRQFRRIYICYAGMKIGSKIFGREIVGLDGCFMKGPYPGQTLCDVGVNGNNVIYALAFALVETETYQTWAWLLKNL
ncbi:hypothetical protein HanPI659440_Chr11g0408841 [Helianthus annuus]|nr:hypothetical protein HanPI659440_Chr11g0408841 [Helianthus annuus]